MTFSTGSAGRVITRQTRAGPSFSVRGHKASRMGARPRPPTARNFAVADGGWQALCLSQPRREPRRGRAAHLARRLRSAGQRVERRRRAPPDGGAVDLRRAHWRGDARGVSARPRCRCSTSSLPRRTSSPRSSSSSTRPTAARALRDALRPHIASTTYVILDCPPSLGLLTLNALAAATRVLVPLQCETSRSRG